MELRLRLRRFHLKSYVASKEFQEQINFRNDLEFTRPQSSVRFLVSQAGLHTLEMGYNSRFFFDTCMKTADAASESCRVKFLSHIFSTR